MSTVIPPEQNQGRFENKIFPNLFEEEEIYAGLFTMSDLLVFGVFFVFGLMLGLMMGIVGLLVVIGFSILGGLVVFSKRAIRHSKEKGYFSALLYHLKTKITGKDTIAY